MQYVLVLQHVLLAPLYFVCYLQHFVQVNLPLLFVVFRTLKRYFPLQVQEQDDRGPGAPRNQEDQKDKEDKEKLAKKKRKNRPPVLSV